MIEPAFAVSPAPGLARPRTGHVVLPSGEWALWPVVAVRSAGFPAHSARRLAVPTLGAAADRYLSRGDDDGLRDYREVFASAIISLERELQGVAGSGRFQCAVAWQNHHVLKRAVLPLLSRRAGTDPRNSHHRQRESLVASYLQRYCLKNDTIGFFGPVGWASVDGMGPTTVQPGARLIQSYEVFFETWAIDQLAAAVASTEGMAAWLCPRRVPFLRLEDGKALLPSRPAVPIDPIAEQALLRCDGTQPASHIASQLVETGHASSVDEVLDVMTRLRKRRWITWSLEVPIDPRPEIQLRRSIERIGVAELREDALERLERLERARSTVAAAWQEPDRLVQALDELDSTFVALTSKTPTRNLGKTYGGRTLVYHDARRDLRMTIGAELLDALAPLELVLTSARWVLHRIERVVRDRVREHHDQLAVRHARPVDLASLWFECMSVTGSTAGAAREIGHELRRRWLRILGLRPEARRLSYRSDDLRAAVAESFDTPHTAWRTSPYFSPDIMIAATDDEAIRRGDFLLVLGELHLAIIAYRHNCFVTQHPASEELLACLDLDTPGPRLLPVLPKDGQGRLTVRTHPALVRDVDYLVALYHNTCRAARPRLLMSADLIVEQVGESLVVRISPDHTFDVMECFSEMLMDIAIDAFDIFGELDHTPRVNVDRLVLSRETWRCDAATLSFANEKDEAIRFAGARAWAASLSLPRRVFVSSPLELKPFFVDFDAPHYVELLTKAARRMSRERRDDVLTISEMLPDLNELWLRDADGHRYTSELRFTAVDQRVAQ